MRLGSAVAGLALSVLITVACSQTVRGKASLPLNNADFAHDPQITNIGVDTPVSPSAQRSAAPSQGQGSSGEGLSEYLKEHAVSVAPVPAGQGMTVSVPTLPGWKNAKPEDAAEQISIVLPASGGDNVLALMSVKVYKLSGNVSPDELAGASKNSIAGIGSLQASDDAPYQGSPSAGGVVTITTKQGSRVVELLRNTFVQKTSSSPIYFVNSIVACPAGTWESLRNDLIRLDSNIAFEP